MFYNEMICIGTTFATVEDFGVTKKQTLNGMKDIYYVSVKPYEYRFKQMLANGSYRMYQNKQIEATFAISKEHYAKLSQGKTVVVIIEQNTEGEYFYRLLNVLRDDFGFKKEELIPLGILMDCVD